MEQVPRTTCQRTSRSARTRSGSRIGLAFGETESPSILSRPATQHLPVKRG